MQLSLSAQTKPYEPLKSLGIWGDLSLNTQATLVEIATEEGLERGQTSQHRVGIVLSGVLGIKRQLNDGRWLYTSLLHEGDGFDLRREERQPQGQVIALKESLLLALPAQLVDHQVRTNCEICEAFRTMMREYAARCRDHTMDVAIKTPIERVTSALFEFKRWPESKRLGRSGDLHLPITRNDLAHYLGIKPETVSRVFRKLADEGLISLPKPNQVKLVGTPKIRNIANGGRPRRGRSA